MNYSRTIRRKSIAVRVIVLCSIALVVGLLLGGVVGYAIETYITAKDKPKEDMQTSEQEVSDFTVYGSYDSDYFTEELPLDWESGDVSFTLLDVPMSEEEQEFVFYLCSGYSINFPLVMALIQYESNFQPDVISKTNDYGLMQINQVNHAQLTEILGVTDYLDPYQNMRAGCFTLRKLFEKYEDVNLVLMAYNMGENGARRLWEQGIYSTSYTDGVLAIQRRLEGDTNAGKLEDS